MNISTKVYISFFLTILSHVVFASEPDWVLSPEKAGYDIAIVGSAMPQKMGKAAQYRMAEMSARRQFSNMKSVFVKSKSEGYTDSAGQASFSVEGYENSSGLMTFSQLIKDKEWKHPDTGELFILYVIKP